jgi:hypothetical protein
MHINNDDLNHLIGYLCREFCLRQDQIVAKLRCNADGPGQVGAVPLFLLVIYKYLI